MTRPSIKISAEQEITILQFWAQAMDIKRTFTPEEIQSVPGLSKAIEVAKTLPDGIGWGNDLADTQAANMPRARKT
ncbi:hypothetical protein [Microvirga terricola]|uniref:Uncharacterized protein n=1 Tax=Microvirga terricola TaxID=2719797 RepID=A0ABX0V7T9_9HYPH|nr:hypothetical protein [Microvirga terricola]NIX75274.1 hypothetical protein [Microvirga terricola]